MASAATFFDHLKHLLVLVFALGLGAVTGWAAISPANMTNVNFSKIRVTGFDGALVTTNNVYGKGLDDPTK